MAYVVVLSQLVMLYLLRKVTDQDFEVALTSDEKKELLQTWY